ncbi:uncharacterized protein LOC130293783 isoform X2 [Hyla sarda]|uniref:uncharacterized protein LOC130293783 isoform X2 n=1 Tax=Hyla sarda TaxID=327740 RepID=UPI0024C44D7F|nr:uncharacterized protein LOC130293783 isoform X2 [Hyla sarda]
MPAGGGLEGSTNLQSPTFPLGRTSSDPGAHGSETTPPLGPPPQGFPSPAGEATHRAIRYTISHYRSSFLIHVPEIQRSPYPETVPDTTYRTSCSRGTSGFFSRTSGMPSRSKLLTYVVLLLQMGSSIFAITAILTNHWGVIPSQSTHFGLSTLCDRFEACASVVIIGADDVLNLLSAVFCLGVVFAIVCGILELCGTYACFLVLGAYSFLLALLGFAALVHSVVVFNNAISQQYRFSWSYALGWMSVVMAVISGALGFYSHWTEPKTKPESPVPDQAAIQTVAGDLQNTSVINEYALPPTS